jgi:endonuclease/exonuclease/phosphatase family metal-dependent hydrolase
VTSFVIASHNVMHGLRLAELLPTYQALVATTSLSLLCVQENQTHDTGSHAEVIRAALGTRFAVCCPDEATGLALVYDHDRFSIQPKIVVPLPKLARMPRIAHLYMASRDPEQKYAQVLTVTPRLGDPFTLINFHLDAAGGNMHRQAQLATVTTALRARHLHERVVACGDANIFTLTHRRHRRAYDALLSPLADIGAIDTDTRPTHFFARSREPRWGQRLLRALGRFRFDLPRRYDVICSNLEVMARGQVETPDSDHDLLWARIALGSS